MTFFEQLKNSKLDVNNNPMNTFVNVVDRGNNACKKLKCGSCLIIIIKRKPINRT